MVTRAARYVVVVDENRVVGFDVTTGINFQIPQNCYLAAPSILTWMMDVKLLNSVASLNVLINNVQIYNGT
jgi:hypothetical protein